MQFEDSDVIAEKESVIEMRPDSSALIVQDVHKYYGSFHAVRGVSFHVEIGDCFGLLGLLISSQEFFFFFEKAQIHFT